VKRTPVTRSISLGAGAVLNDEEVFVERDEDTGMPDIAEEQQREDEHGPKLHVDIIDSVEGNPMPPTPKKTNGKGNGSRKRKLLLTLRKPMMMITAQRAQQFTKAAKPRHHQRRRNLNSPRFTPTVSRPSSNALFRKAATSPLMIQTGTKKQARG
jgi:hypothetical protein